MWKDHSLPIISADFVCPDQHYCPLIHPTLNPDTTFAMCLFLRRRAHSPAGPNTRIANSGSAQRSPASSSLPLNVISTPAPATPRLDPLRPQTPASITRPGSGAAPPESAVTPPQTPSVPGPAGSQTYSYLYSIYQNVTNQTVNSGTQTRWEQALARLSPEDKAVVDLNSTIQNPNRLTILGVFLQETEKMKVECQDRQWMYTNTRGQKVLVRNRVNTLLVNVNRYTGVPNPAPQALPSVLSLARGGVKILLQVFPPFISRWKPDTNCHPKVAITHMESTAIAMESLDSLARILGRCGIYEELYGQKVLDSCQSLNDALIDLYALILEYLCYLKRHLGHNTAGEAFCVIETTP